MWSWLPALPWFQAIVELTITVVSSGSSSRGAQVATPPPRPLSGTQPRPSRNNPCARLPTIVEFSISTRPLELKMPPPTPTPWIGSGTSGLPDWLRSEEHTSELQSRENLVCRLLLEK